MAYPRIRILILVAAALCGGAASPLDRMQLTMQTPSGHAPYGFLLPRAAPEFTPAPVPDIDRDGPTSPKGARATVKLLPSFFHPHDTSQGAGFTPNSSIFGEQTKKLRLTPGLNLSVPLE